VQMWPGGRALRATCSAPRCFRNRPSGCCVATCGAGRGASTFCNATKSGGAALGAALLHATVAHVPSSLHLYAVEDRHVRSMVPLCLLSCLALPYRLRLAQSNPPCSACDMKITLARSAAHCDPQTCICRASARRRCSSRSLSPKITRSLLSSCSSRPICRRCVFGTAQLCAERRVVDRAEPRSRVRHKPALWSLHPPNLVAENRTTY
jgi:hypothetical protein